MYSLYRVRPLRVFPHIIINVHSQQPTFPRHCCRHPSQEFSPTPALVEYYQICCPGTCHRVFSHGRYRQLHPLDHSSHFHPLLLSSFLPTPTHHLTHLLHSLPLPLTYCPPSPLCPQPSTCRTPE